MPRTGLQLALALLLALFAACTTEHVPPPTPDECKDQSPGELFAQRIEPLFAQDRPKSCNQCHLSGIDLGSFKRDTPCETMACLVEQGLVDLDAPDQSKILSWIERAQPDSELITDKVIQEEYDGFLSWIEYSATCQASVCRDVTCKRSEADPFCDSADPITYDTANDPGGCSDVALERVFRDAVYADRGRCYPCHFEKMEAAAPDAPKWITQDGTCDEASLATMRTVVRRGLVNVADPTQSLLLLKPLGPEYGGVEHGGASKFHGNEDQGYKNFLYWLERYAGCQKAP